MGIHDREYIRSHRGGGGAGSFASRGIGSVGMWSVNTWIIVICVAVFAIDLFTAQDRLGPRTAVQLVSGRSYPLEGMALPPGAQPQIDGLQPGPNGMLRAPLVDPRTGGHVGWVEIFPMNGVLSEYLHFSTQRGFLQVEFWRLIGFQFLHANLMHLVFNMIGLYFFGPLVERYLGSKRYLAFYLLCGICGALLYSLLNLGGVVATMMAGEEVRVPGLLFNDTYMPLIGASAGVFGVLMAGAYLAPNAMVLLFFILPMRLSTVAYGLVILALFTIITGGNNAGGEAGHLGGAIAGFYFIRRPHHLHGFFDFLGRVDPTSHHYRHAKPGRPSRPKASQREIDRILDKINREGIQSLSDEEKRTLRDASRK